MTLIENATNADYVTLVEEWEVRYKNDENEYNWSMKVEHNVYGEIKETMIVNKHFSTRIMYQSDMKVLTIITISNPSMRDMLRLVDSI